ncbi:MAG: hypothetical protein R6V78_20675 [Desulfosarcina sp.]
MQKRKPPKDKRKSDPYLDRRSGQDRRQTYDIDYFADGGPERRQDKDRRENRERRAGCVQVTQWSSVCVDDPSADGPSGSNGSK